MLEEELLVETTYNRRGFDYACAGACRQIDDAPRRPGDLRNAAMLVSVII